MDVPRKISAHWFDGLSARRSEVTLMVSGLTVRVNATLTALARGDAAMPSVHVPLDTVHISDRIGSTPYRLSFPDGSLAVTSDHEAVEAAFHLTPSSHWLARMERARWAVAAAMTGLGVALYFAYVALIPMLAETVAQRIPREAEKTMGTVALKGLDRWMLKPSALDAKEIAVVRNVFDEMARTAGLSDAVELQFRNTVPNALALPGGTMIVTDGLVRLFKSDGRLLAGVIAHELGHIHHRHSLRHLLAGSASALMVGALLGDVSGVSALVTSAPLVLSTLHYTREAEVEADKYAFDLLKKSGRSPKDFADSIRRFEAMEMCMQLRQQRREASKSKTWRVGDPTEDDDEPADGDDSRSDHKSESKSTTKAPGCLTDPEAAIKGHESEIAAMRNQDRETGYMHTHPVTQERIRAAEAAAIR